MAQNEIPINMVQSAFHAKVEKLAARLNERGFNVTPRQIYELPVRIPEYLANGYAFTLIIPLTLETTWFMKKIGENRHMKADHLKINYLGGENPWWLITITMYAVNGNGKVEINNLLDLHTLWSAQEWQNVWVNYTSADGSIDVRGNIQSAIINIDSVMNSGSINIDGDEKPLSYTI